MKNANDGRGLSVILTKMVISDEKRRIAKRDEQEGEALMMTRKDSAC